MKCIFCIPPLVCRAIKTALPRRALAGRFRTRKPAAQSRLIGCSPRRIAVCAGAARRRIGPRAAVGRVLADVRRAYRRRAGGQDTERCIPPDMYICAAGCRIPYAENRFLNAESFALARIWPDAAAFPVRRARMKSKNTEVEDAAAVFALRARRAHEVGADLRGQPCRRADGLAAAQTGLPPCGHMRCALTAAYAVGGDARARTRAVVRTQISAAQEDALAACGRRTGLNGRRTARRGFEPAAGDFSESGGGGAANAARRADRAARAAAFPLTR